jgi:fumarate reductase subunit D
MRIFFGGYSLGFTVCLLSLRLWQSRAALGCGEICGGFMLWFCLTFAVYIGVRMSPTGHRNRVGEINESLVPPNWLTFAAGCFTSNCLLAVLVLLLKLIIHLDTWPDSTAKSIVETVGTVIALLVGAVTLFGMAGVFQLYLHVYEWYHTPRE